MIIETLKNKYTIYDIVNKYNIEVQYNDMCVCPFHSDKNASMKLYKNNTFHCFGCGFDGDIIDFVKKIENCDTLKACEIINGGSFTHFEQPKKKAIKKPVNVDFNKYLTDCHKNLYLTDYFTKRGLTKETQERFLLGYDTKYKCVTIPYNRKLNYYQSRSVVDKKFYKPATSIAGSEPLFNAKALDYYDKVFVVESPICAISIMQCGYPAVAICGVQGYKKIKPSKSKLLIALDNDEVGQETAKLLQKSFGGQIVNIADECKDPNELLIKNPTQLINNLKNAYKE